VWVRFPSPAPLLVACRVPASSPTRNRARQMTLERRNRMARPNSPGRDVRARISERNFFHRTSAQTVREARVVNDLASTDLDAVMRIAPRRDKV
jgi:hypothetical protein